MFNVTAEHLNAAHGQVRCGHCDTVFDALGNLQDDWKDHIHEFIPKPESEDENENENESFEHELVFDESLLDNDDLEYNVKPDIYEDAEDLPVDDILKNQPDDVSETEAEEFTEDEDDEPSALAELSKHAKPGIDPEIFKLRKQSEVLIRQLTKEISDKSNISDRYQTMSNLQDHARKSVLDGNTDKETDELFDSELVTTANKAPAAIRDELEQIQSGQTKSHSLAYFLLLLSILSVTVIQAAYYFREPLARVPSVHPFIATLCDWTGCSLPLKNDAARGLNSLVMRNHSITPIAGKDDQLRINLLFTNTADYTQAYPTILITMSNDNEAVTAMRQIKPQAYLGSHIGVDDGFAAKTSIEVIIDIIKPKQNIHSYEFDFL
jgi:predicted Zn finger-like uncharacterized protein